MPELPEVEVVRRGLQDHVVGRTIEVGASSSAARVARRHVPGPARPRRPADRQPVAAAARRGKYLWLVLEAPDGTEQALIIHLGHERPAARRGSPTPPRRSTCTPRFDFADDGPQLRFVDQRTFGGMALSDLVPTCRQGIPGRITHIAPDPFEPGYDRAAVVARMRHAAIARSNGRCSTRGWSRAWATSTPTRRSGGPRCTASVAAASLTRPALGRILDHARDVMLEALGQGGTSFDALYVNVNGASSGYFDRSLHAYGQEGRPCRRCGTPIRRESFMNRSSFSCPRCQPRPRTLRR